MEIILKNGKKQQIDFNPIVLEYLEEYEGGIEQIKQDIDDKNKRFYVFNYIIYCMLQASSERELGYREAVSLVDINDYEKIIDFIVNQFNKTKQKDKKNKNKHRK